MCTWADLTAVIGFHPNLKPLQRHKGVPSDTSEDGAFHAAPAAQKRYIQLA